MRTADDPPYMGEKINKKYNSGPSADRRCTDVLCLLIFFAFWSGFGYMGYYAVQHGRPEYFMAPYNQFGNPCGLDLLKDYPYLYFIVGKDNSFKINNTVCVSSCPDNKTKYLSCSPDYTRSGRKCTDIKVYETSLYFDRFCLSTEALETAYTTASTTLRFSIGVQAIKDLKATWWMILFIGLIALVIGFIYLCLMENVSGLVVWSILIGFVGALTFGGVYLLQEADEEHDSTITTKNDTIIDQINLKYVAYTCFGLAGLAFLLICFFRERISIAISVLKASADFISDEKEVLLVPPIFFIKSLASIIAWIGLAIYVVGINNIRPDEDNYPIADIDWNRTGTFFMWYFVFALFWNQAFEQALAKFIISSITCLWYFKQGRKHNVRGPLTTSIKRSIIHLGSIALGSFLIGSLDFARFVINFLSTHLRDLPAENPTAKFVLGCAQCCLSCLEKAVKFINGHAYIHMAITGDDFCTSTREAFYLILRNAARFTIVHGIGHVISIFGEIVITAFATFCGYQIFTKSDHFKDRLHSPIIPTIFVGLNSLIVAHVMMSVYATSADTIIHCFAMDEEINDGHAQHAPERLAHIDEINAPKKLLAHQDR